METILTISYAGNTIFGIYILFLMFKLEKGLLNILRISAVVWSIFASIAFIFLNYTWKIGIENKEICVPGSMIISVHYWQLSISLAIMFVLLIMFLSIKKGIYGCNDCN